jgi:hypothetical protein
MGQQSIRQEARRAALDAQSKRRRERSGRERRSVGLAVRVLVALRERAAAVSNAERRAGEALREMTEDEGLSCERRSGGVATRSPRGEATRLRRVVEDNGVGRVRRDDKNSMPGAAERLAQGGTDGSG